MERGNWSDGRRRFDAVANWKNDANKLQLLTEEHFPKKKISEALELNANKIVTL